VYTGFYKRAFVVVSQCHISSTAQQHRERESEATAAYKKLPAHHIMIHLVEITSIINYVIYGVYIFMYCSNNVKLNGLLLLL